MKQSARLETLIMNQRLKLDELRSKEKVEAATLSDYIDTISNQALEYAESHIGEYVWKTHCPNAKCKFYTHPIFSLQQQPHFAMDFAVSPYIIWNQQIFHLCRKYYLKEEDWGPIEKSYESKGLSFKDSAAILRISTIGWIMAIYEKQHRGDEDFPIDLEKIVDNPELLSEYIGEDIYIEDEILE
jgi:hypothetical protein